MQPNRVSTEEVCECFVCVLQVVKVVNVIGVLWSIAPDLFSHAIALSHASSTQNLT